MTPADHLRSLSQQERLALAAKTTWYHVLDLGNGVVTTGDFDLRPVIDQYGFPEDLRGKRVLDVGRASGFFSFELEKRGAEVTATELPYVTDKDYVGSDMVRTLIRERDWDGGQATSDPVYGDRMDFALAHLILNSTVKPVSVRLQDLSPETVPGAPFDLVFVGSLLNHVSDPIGSLRRIHSVTGDLCIVVNPVDPDDISPTPRTRLIGRGARGLTSWWLPNVAGLEEMMYCAGFDEVTVHCEALDLPMPGGYPLRHAVVHARRLPESEAVKARWSDWFQNGYRREGLTLARSPREVALEEALAHVEQDNDAKLALIQQLQADMAEQRRQFQEALAHAEQDSDAKLGVIQQLEADMAEQRRLHMEGYAHVEQDNDAKLALIQQLQADMAEQRRQLMDMIERVDADSTVRLNAVRALTEEVVQLRARLEAAQQPAS